MQIIYIPYLAILICFSISFSLSIKGFLKTRPLTALYNALISLFFLMATISILAENFINDNVIIWGLNLDYLDFTFVLFLILGFLTWLVEIDYITHEEMSRLLLIFAFIGGMIILGELYGKFPFAIFINSILEITGLILFSVLAISYFADIFRNIPYTNSKKYLGAYLAGLIALIVGLILIALGDIYLILNIRDLMRLCYDFGLLFVTLGVIPITLLPARNPMLLETTLAHPHSALFVTPDGITIMHIKFNRSHDSIDPTLIGSAIAAISSLTKEIIGKKVELKTIKFENFSIIVSLGKRIAGYILVERPTRILEEILARAVKHVEKRIEPLDQTILIMRKDLYNEIIRDIKEIFSPII